VSGEVPGDDSRGGRWHLPQQRSATPGSGSRRPAQNSEEYPIFAQYERWTRKPLIYLPVMLRGDLIGYLWGSRSYISSGFMRRFPVPGPNFGPLLFWEERLERCYRERLTPSEAVRRWIGAPEDPIGGGIPDTREREAPNLLAVWNQLNPTGPPLGSGPDIQDGMFEDGTPVDRFEDWGPLVGAPPPPTYRTETDTAVRYLPVTKDDAPIGYIWSSVCGNAAGYLPHAAAGRSGTIAAGLWKTRLSDAYARGESPLTALRYCKTFPAHRLAGGIEKNAIEHEIASLAELGNIAQQ
jgi:hypothetical protein